MDKDCIICGAKNEFFIEMHHVRKFNNAETRQYKDVMQAINRKQIPVCKNSHNKIYRGEYDGESLRKIKNPLQ